MDAATSAGRGNPPPCFDLTSSYFIPTRATHKAKHKRYQGPANRSEHDVYIIEVGYTTGDLQHAEKLAQKTTQHARLKEELMRAGWTVHYTEAQIVTLSGKHWDSNEHTETPPVQTRHDPRTAGPRIRLASKSIGKR
jgi:hypothetical protein